MNSPSFVWTVWAVARKEWIDALRETRTLLVVLGSALLVGPLGVAFMLTSVPPDRGEEAIPVLASGMQFSPRLGTYLERHNIVVKDAPPGFEAGLSSGQLAGPVVVVQPDFESVLARGDMPAIDVLTGSGGQEAELDAARIHQLLQGFVRERVSEALSARGIPPRTLEPVQLTMRSLAPSRTQSQTFAGSLPFLLLMAVLFAALNSALDTTCGERERGSLEPLLVSPSRHSALTVGKWCAVVGLSVLVAVLSCLSLMLARWLMHSERLDAMLRFGPHEAFVSLLLMLPYAAALPAVLMAVAIRCRTFKEAQANSNLVILLLSGLPILTMIAADSGEATWQLWTPVLAQMVLIGQVLNGEHVGVQQMLIPLAVAMALTAASMAHVSRHLRKAATK